MPPTRHRETSPLRIVIPVTVVAAIVLAILYVRVQSRRSALLAIQQTCLEYTAPADRIVYDDQREDAAVIPPAWLTMMSWIAPEAPPPSNPVLFLHERQTQLGKRGLVCVQADRANRKLQVTFVHPGASTLDPVAITDVGVIPRPREGMVLLSVGENPFATKLPADPDMRADLRFFAGQFDPADPTHFTIPYQFENRAGELEMWVQDERTIHYVDRRFEFSRPPTQPTG